MIFAFEYILFYFYFGRLRVKSMISQPRPPGNEMSRFGRRYLHPVSCDFKSNQHNLFNCVTLNRKSTTKSYKKVQQIFETVVEWLTLFNLKLFEFNNLGYASKITQPYKCLLVYDLRFY